MRANILLLLWRCWFLREDCIHSDGRETISRSVQFLTKYAEELKNANEPEDWTVGRGTGDMLARPTDNVNRQWIPPVGGSVKINSDAAFLADNGESSAGAVARDCRGHVFVAVCKKLPHCHSVEEAEARAVLVGLQTLAGFFNGQVIVETDNLTIAKELANQTPSRSPLYGLLMDIKNAAAAFDTYSISCVRRDSNKLAHGLAALTRSDGDQVVIANVLDSLRQLMISEYTPDCTGHSE